MSLTSRQRAELRARAHHLAATVHIGHQGVTASMRLSLEDALRTHELVKIQFSKRADVSTRDAANALAARVGAEVVQAIGRTATLFRERPGADR